MLKDDLQQVTDLSNWINDAEDIEEAALDAGDAKIARKVAADRRRAHGRLMRLIRKLLKRRRFSLSGRREVNPQTSLKTYLFLYERSVERALRDQRIVQVGGTRGRRNRSVAKASRETARQAAKAVMLEAKRLGLWDEEFATTYALHDWL